MKILKFLGILIFVRPTKWKSEMKKILVVIFVLSALITKSQHIIVSGSDTIHCKITKATSMNIFYTEKGIGKSIAVKDVAYYDHLYEQDNIKPEKVVKTYTPGDQFKKAATHFYIGNTLMGGGVALFAVGATMPDDPTLIIVGGITAIAGVILLYESFSHIYKAGELMNKKGIALSRTGVGVSYNF